MKKVLPVGIAALLFVVFALACDDGPDDEPALAPEPTSPANVLECVRISFNQRSIETIYPVLGGSIFFRFNPEDVGRTPPGSEYIIPGGWVHTALLRAITNMFEQAYSIDLAINTSQIGTPGEEARHYQVDNVTISLLVMVDEVNGFIAEQGYCDFEFVKVLRKTDPAWWHMTYWYDWTATAPDSKPPIQPASLGMILAFYY